MRRSLHADEPGELLYDLNKRITEAVDLAATYTSEWIPTSGYFWIIDQMVRTLLGEEEYAKWVKGYNEELEIDLGESAWDVGTKP